MIAQDLQHLCRWLAALDAERYYDIFVNDYLPKTITEEYTVVNGRCFNNDFKEGLT